MIIRNLAKDKGEEDRLIRELLDRFYKDLKEEVNKRCAAKNALNTKNVQRIIA